MNRSWLLSRLAFRLCWTPICIAHLCIPLASLAGNQDTAALTAPPSQGRPALEPARRDPFEASAVSPPAPTVQTSTKKKGKPPSAENALNTAQDEQPVPAPAPMAPTLNAEYAGRMMGPNGELRVYVLHENEWVLLRAGAALSNGYVVERIDAQNVHFVHQQTKSTATLVLPAAPALQTY